MSYEDYKNELKNDLLTKRVIRQEVSQDSRSSTKKRRPYYDAHKDEFKREERVFLREILVATPTRQRTPRQPKKAKDLADRGKKGEKFDDLAHNNSDSPSAQQDGESALTKKASCARKSRRRCGISRAATSPIRSMSAMGS